MIWMCRLSCLAALLILAAGPAAPAAETPDRPNILWIGVDQLRFDTPGCNRNPICRTPSIDRLASQGLNFTNAYTTCCLCSPARASMLTGTFAFRHGMGTNCDLYHSMARELPQPQMLLHHRLANLGYRCGFAGKWHVGTEKGPADYGFEGMNLPGYGDVTKSVGFQAYLKEKNLSYGTVQDPIFGNPNAKTLLAGRWAGPTESTPSYYLAEYTIDLLRRFAADKRPFFVNCQFWGPHSPHLPSPEYAGRHDRAAIQPWVNFQDDLKDKPAIVRRFRPDFYRALPADWSGWREIVGLYYDYTTMIDAQIGRILEELDRLGLADRTIVVFESDHGDMIGSHGLFDKGFMYQEAFRIPMIVRWPGRCPPGRQSNALVYNMDIFPTILDALGIPDDTLDGRSFLPLLAGQPLPKPRDAIYLEFHGIRHLYSQRALVTTDGYKYIFNPGDFDECYDLNTDPGELTNLVDSPEHRPLVSRLRERLKTAAAQAKDPIRDYVSKLFGDWENLSGQHEAAAMIQGTKKD